MSLAHPWPRRVAPFEQHAMLRCSNVRKSFHTIFVGPRPLRASRFGGSNRSAVGRGRRDMSLVHPWPRRTAPFEEHAVLSSSNVRKSFHTIFVEPPTAACLAVRRFDVPPAERAKTQKGHTTV